MSRLPASVHLTDGYSAEAVQRIRGTHVGMASWAHEGPFGATCGDCKHYGCWKQIRDAEDRVVKTTFLFLLSQKVAANGEQNHLFGKIHTSAMGGWNGSAKIE
jgi:hypothetical protein